MARGWGEGQQVGRRKGSVLPHSAWQRGGGKGDYCFEDRGRSSCEAEASSQQDRDARKGRGAQGRRWVRRELSPGLEPRWGSPASWAARQPRARARGAVFGRPAQLPRAPGAGAACPGPVGLRLRAAGRGEENNRRGGREREGAGARDAGLQAGGPAALWVLEVRESGALWVLEVRENVFLIAAPRPPTRPAISFTALLPMHPPRSSGSGNGSRNPWRPGRRPFPSCWSHLPPPAAEWVGQPSVGSPPPINPFYTVCGLGPALSPRLQASPPSRICWGEGRKFPGLEASRALPQISEPPPSQQLPADRSPDRGCPALGTRSSSESVASSSFALVPLSLLFSSRVPGPCLTPALSGAPSHAPVAGDSRPGLLPATQDRPRPLRSSCAAAAPFPWSSCARRGPFSRSQLRVPSASRGPSCAVAQPLQICARRPLGSSGAALAQMCWGPARAPVPGANSPDQTAPPAPSRRAPWRTPLAARSSAAAPGAAPARLERSWRPGGSRFLVPPTGGGGGGGGGRYGEPNQYLPC